MEEMSCRLQLLNVEALFSTTGLKLNSQNAAIGCLLGACCGDAAGATLEFIGRKPTYAEVENALTMPGGGVWNVAPGQITDDGELTLCLALALADQPVFEIESIARQYARWIESPPFDIGTTTRTALGCFLHSAHWNKICEEQGYAIGMGQAAVQGCLDSKANGSLMRATPLGIWGHHLSDTDLAGYARQDSALSHPNQSCQDAVACYAIAIANLMRAPGDRLTAFHATRAWAKAYANTEVRGWLEDAENDLNYPYHPQAGFIRIAFTHAFRLLIQGADFMTAMREVLSGGGDTDTNACIVGGLIGAADGCNAIPAGMAKAVIKCDTSKGRHNRPGFLSGKHIPDLAVRLMSGVDCRGKVKA